MEPIKVSVSVELNFSQDAKNFITSIFSNARDRQSTTAPIEPQPIPAAPACESVSAAQTGTTSPSKPASPKPNNDLTIDDVRKALSLKVNSHRAEIKAKLDELGAPSVTRLDPSKYSEMYNFLESLD